MRRKRKETECLLKLERVLGLTTNKPMVLSVNSPHDLVAYAAGCVVVLYNHKLDKQVGLLCSSTLKKQSSDASSSSSSGSTSLSSGAGGSPRTTASSISSGIQWMNSSMAGANINPLAGLMPMAVTDGSVASGFGTSNPSSNKNIKPKPISCLSFSPDGQFLAIGEMGHQPRILIWEVVSQMLVGELQGHKFGVQAVQFSPNSRHLVSLGFQHDGYIHVWNWRTGTQIASNKVTTKVNALAFSADGSFFVTAGLRHIKFWYLNVGANKRGGLSGTALNTQVLDGRAGILGDLRHGNFVDAVCSQDGRFTYTVTSSGVLCLFTEGRVLEKWIDLHIRGAYSVNLDEKAIICACTDGIVRVFEPETLEYIGTLPKPSPVGAFAGNMHAKQQEEDATDTVYPDILASQYDVSSNCLICIYSDRSLYVWDIRDINNPVIVRNHLFHSDCVWGAEILPLPTADNDISSNPFPADTFLTYSADGSIKFWNLDQSISALPAMPDQKEKDAISSQPRAEILSVLYVDENCKSWIQPPENQDGLEPGFNVVPLECGIRTVRVSADGRYLASGDKGGNLRVHDLSTLQQVTYQEAHDTEILAIDFTDPGLKDSPFLVATAGRDRLLHVFDVQNNYALVQTLDDHSSSITCIRFTADGTRMMSCGADKSIIFRNCHKNPEGLSFQPYHQAPGRATFYDMGMNDASQTISVVSGDRRFNVFALNTGKAIKSFKAETKGDDLTAGMAEVCSMTHISLDPTGTIAAASGSDKSIRIYDLLHGTCLAHTICHSELVTSVKFTANFERIVSTSADGCVLVWRLSKDIVRRIVSRVQENVTLPGYLQAKATEALLTSNNATATGALSPRPLRLRRTTDQLGAYASDHSTVSRRNSITSIASEDCELRSEDNSDDWNEQRAQSGTSKNPKKDSVAKENFLPISVSTFAARKTPGTRSRVSASIARSPLTRSRQNSVSQPTTASKLQSSTPRPHSQPEQPPWNRNVVKDKMAFSSSPIKVRAASPASQTRTPKLRAKNSLLSPSNARPRATSLTVPTETTLRMDGVKAKSIPSTRQTLSDHTPEDPPAAHGEDDDAGMSEDIELKAEDVKEVVPLGRRPVSSAPKSVVASTALSVGTHQHTHTADEAMVAGTSGIQDTQDSTQTGSEYEAADETGASDDREDVDDEDAYEDESISETGSDNDMMSPLQRRNIGPGEDAVNSSFGEGEHMRGSPTSDKSHQVTSPSGRVLSVRPDFLERRSLSSRFLTAHAASIMMSLVQSARDEQSSIPIGAMVGDLPERAHSTTPRPLDTQPSEKPGMDTLKTEINSAGELQSRVERPLEERLNLQSLNLAAMKWKNRSLGGGSHPVNRQEGQGHDGLGSKQVGTGAESSESMRSGVRSEDYFQEVERTRKRLAKLGYLVTPSGGTEQANFNLVSESLEDTTGIAQTSANAEVKDDGGHVGDLALQPCNASTMLCNTLYLSTETLQQPVLSGRGVVVSTVVVNGPDGMNMSCSTEEELNVNFSAASATAVAVTGDGDSEFKKSLTCSAVVRQPETTERHRPLVQEDNEQSLRDAFDRISSLITHKALNATRASQQQQQQQQHVGSDRAGEKTEEVVANQVCETKQWMMETREGLLNLVGEVQGHLWALERAVAGNGGEGAE
ncbi:mitogen-activated protein kinase binding protein 1 [Mortierella claussenii]|nr:mitogen-activated protein kinase binding protein 1 [Mortierella claussenii]